MPSRRGETLFGRLFRRGERATHLSSDFLYGDSPLARAEKVGSNPSAVILDDELEDYVRVGLRGNYNDPNDVEGTRARYADQQQRMESLRSRLTVVRKQAINIAQLSRDTRFAQQAGAQFNTLRQEAQVVLDELGNVFSGEVGFATTGSRLDLSELDLPQFSARITEIINLIKGIERVIFQEYADFRDQVYLAQQVDATGAVSPELAGQEEYLRRREILEKVLKIDLEELAAVLPHGMELAHWLETVGFDEAIIALEEIMTETYNVWLEKISPDITRARSATAYEAEAAGETITARDLGEQFTDLLAADLRSLELYTKFMKVSTDIAALSPTLSRQQGVSQIPVGRTQQEQPYYVVRAVPGESSDKLDELWENKTELEEKIAAIDQRCIYEQAALRPMGEWVDLLFLTKAEEAAQTAFTACNTEVASLFSEGDESDEEEAETEVGEMPESAAALVESVGTLLLERQGMGIRQATQNQLTEQRRQGFMNELLPSRQRRKAVAPSPQPTTLSEGEAELVDQEKETTPAAAD